MSSHHINEALSSVYCIGLKDDEKHSTIELFSCLKKIERILADPSKIVLNRDLGRFQRLLSAHITMKYTLTVDFVDLCLRTIMAAYHSDGVKVNTQARLLSTLSNLIKKNKYMCTKSASHHPSSQESSASNFTFVLDWMPLWRDLIALVSRENRQQILGSEKVLSELLTALPDFLHTARRFFSNDRVQLDLLTTTAMNKLQDTTFPGCCEGVLLLVNCLPTWYPHYAEILPLWVDKWLSVTHNAQWDWAWLTLLARARKHCNPQQAGGCAIDWYAYLPLFFSKVRELIEFPLVQGAKASQNSEFPHAFSPQFAKLSSSTDARKMALKKLAKLIHFAAFTGPPRGGARPGAGAGTGAVSDADADGNQIVLMKPLSSGMTLPKLVSEALAKLDASSSSSSTPTTLKTAPADAQAEGLVLPGAVEIATFLRSIRSYFYPACSGSFSGSLAYFFLALVLQLCRHAGHSAGQRLRLQLHSRGSTSDDNGNGDVGGYSRGEEIIAAFYVDTFHVPTVRYLFRSFYLPYALEGFYSKHPHMSQYCLAGIKNVVAIDTELGHVVLPFFLAALDPAAVSQPHQTPLVMQALNNCFHCLLYPQPVILQYLPEVLKLTLAGVDPSDANKTLLTLSLYSTVFAWIPIYRCDRAGNTATATSFITLASLPIDSNMSQLNSTTTSTSSTASAAASEEHLEALNAYIDEEWAPALLDSIFALLEAQEATVEGAPAPPIGSAVGQCLTYLFQALADVHDLSDSALSQTATAAAAVNTTVDNEPRRKLRRKLQDKICSYFASNTPANAAKASAKIFESMVESDSGIVGRVLSILLDEDVRSASCGAEKLAFRLRLAGGACRGAEGRNLFPAASATSTTTTAAVAAGAAGAKAGEVEVARPEDLIVPIVTSPTFYNHTEKSVREATRKLLKDVLKGALSFYPCKIHPMFPTNVDQQLGAPNVDFHKNMSWHTPTKEVVPRAMGLIKATTTQLMAEVTASLHAIQNASAIPTTTATATAPSANQPGLDNVKKTEELLVSRLWMLERALRGAAEVFGDVIPPPQQTTRSSRSNSVSARMEVDGGGAGENGENDDELDDDDDDDDYNDDGIDFDVASDAGEGSGSSSSAAGGGVGGSATSAAAGVGNGPGSTCYGSSSRLISTGREELLRSLEPEDREFLTRLRVNLLEFLSDTQASLAAIATAGGVAGGASLDDPSTSVGPTSATGTAFSTTTSASVSVISLYAGLRNSTQLQHAWLQLLNLCVTRRMAIIKDVDSIRKMMKYSKLNNRCSFTNVVYRTFKRVHIASQVKTQQQDQGQVAPAPSSSADVGQQVSPYLNIDYWRNHDYSTSTIVCSTWTQYTVRCKELSFAAVRVCVNAREGGVGRNNNNGNDTGYDKNLADKSGSSSSSSGAAAVADPFMRCLGLVVQLCQHEYDKVRSMALKTFEMVSSRFGFAKLTPTFRRILATLEPQQQQVGDISSTAIAAAGGGGGAGGCGGLISADYYQVRGVLSLVDQSRVMKRIMGCPDLSERFLRTMLQSQRTVLTDTVTTEHDKRQRLVNTITDAVVKYCKGWSVLPPVALLSKREKAVPAKVVQLALAGVGYGSAASDARGDLSTRTDSGSGNSSTTAGDAAAAGLRFETFAAYLLLHLIGRADIDIVRSLGCWQWALESLCSPKRHGQPSSTIALAALARLAGNAVYRSGGALAEGGTSISNISTITTEEVGALDGGVNLVDFAVIKQYVRGVLAPISVSGGGSQWPNLIRGIAHTHPRTSDDGASAQWSKGIQPVLQSASLLKVILPRSVTAVRSERNTYSHHFRVEDAAVYLALAQAGLMDTADPDSSSSTTTTTGSAMGPGSIFNADNLRVLFEQCNSDSIETANEGEARALNTTRAELFAGLLRAFRASVLIAGSDHQQNQQQHEEEEEEEAVMKTLQVFLKVFQETVNKVSLDYCKEWEEALSFAYAGVPCMVSLHSASAGAATGGADGESVGVGDPIALFALSGLRQVLSGTKQRQGLVECSTTETTSTASATNVATNAASDSDYNLGAGPDGGGSGNGEDVVDAASAESFTAQAKAVEHVCSLLLSDFTACHVRSLGAATTTTNAPTTTATATPATATATSTSTAPAPAGRVIPRVPAMAVAVVELLVREESALTSPYRAVRKELAYLLSLLVELTAYFLPPAGNVGDPSEGGEGGVASYLHGMTPSDSKLVTRLVQGVTILCGKLGMAALPPTRSAAVAAAVGDGSTSAVSMEQDMASAAATADGPSSSQQSSDAAALTALTQEKHATETVCVFLQFLVNKVPLFRISALLAPLLHVCIVGAGRFTSHDIEVARMCRSTCLLVATCCSRARVLSAAEAAAAISVASQATTASGGGAAAAGAAGSAGAGTAAFGGATAASADPLTHFLVLLKTQLLSAEESVNKSDKGIALHSQETAMQALTVLMLNNWDMLEPTVERKICKDLLAKGVEDPKPEVQRLAQQGMVAYLGLKQPHELAAIAAVYTKNSDVFATREKKRKRQLNKEEPTSSSGTAASKLDPQHRTTVLMMACVLLATPYDLPDYVPGLITSFVRHLSCPPLQDTVVRTVQLFKRTHQDKWEQEFQSMFTADQLAELQGTGAAHYYS